MEHPIQLVVGLGNPGGQYDHTPHNLGFEVLDVLADRQAQRFRRAFGLRAWGVTWQKGPPVIRLLKPRTFMNRSGESVAKAIKRWNLRPEQVLLVYDDLELPLGRLRLRSSGGAGGHNGIRSVVDALNGSEAFPRLRIGVGPRPPGADLVRYVLSPWPASAAELVSAVRQRAADAVTAACQGDFVTAMNEFNAGVVRANGT